jgi:gliding motility-associated protein GldM
MLIGDEPASPKNGPWSAVELREKLTAFSDDCQNLAVTDLKGKMHSIVEEAPEAKALIANTFAFADIPNSEKGEPDEKWETALFYHSPLAAVIAHLSKIESDVILVKNTVLNFLASSINASDLKFSDVTVAVVPKQSYILKGDSFVAEIYLAAYNKASKTKVYMGGEVGEGAKAEVFDYSGKEAIMSGTDGKCKFKINESALGSHSHKGVIVYQDADGSDKAIPFIIPPFTVGEAALVVSPTAMMVFYERVENPVEISVPGVDASQLSVSMSGGSISPKGGGNYMVMPTNGSRDATINVTAVINGKQVSMPAKQFKIKKLPDPTPSFQGKNHMTTTISRGDATAASAVFASMGADFVFQGIPVSINGFTMTVASAGKITPEMRANGGSLSSEMKTALSKVKTGDKIYVERIEASVAGERRPLPSISLKVQ